LDSRGGFNSFTEVVFKPSIVLKVKAGGSFKPEEYWEYFEDLNYTPNAEIEREGRLKNHF